MPSIIRYLVNLPSKSQGLRQSAVNITGSFVASGFSAAAIMLISRILGPSGFGQFSTGYAIALILAKVNDFGLSVATSKLVPVLENQTEQNYLINLINRRRLLISALIFIIGGGLASFLANYVLNVPPLLVLLAVILSFATTYFEQAIFSLQALHKFTLGAVINSMQAMFKLIFTAAFFIWAGTTQLSLVTQVLIIFSFYMASPFLPVLLFKSIRPANIPLSFKIDQALEKGRAKLLKADLRQVVRHASWGIIAAGIIENIDILFVQSYLSDYEAGLLGGVTRIAMLLYVLAYALGSVLNPRVARYTDSQNLQIFWKKAWLIFGACVLGFVFSMFIAQPLIYYSIGPDYLPALDIMRVLLAAGFVTIAAMPFIALFYAFDKPWYFSVSGVLQLAIVLLGNGLLVPEYGLAAAAWTRLGARTTLLVFTAGLGLYLYRGKVGSGVEPKMIKGAED